MERSRLILVRYSLLVITCLVLTSIPLNRTEAFPNPFKAVGNALGGIARGVGNIFGQGLAGLASPTINAFADEANRVLAEALVKADNILAARITQVDAILSKQLNALDQSISEKIEKFDKILDQKIGAVDIVATKAVQNAEDSLISVLRFGAVLILVTCLVFVIARVIILRPSKQTLSSDWLIAGFATVILAAVVAVGASYVITPPAGARVAKLNEDFRQAAMSAYRQGEMNDAAIYAKQLTVLDPTSIHYSAFQKVAEVQRDIMYRPTTLKSAAGAHEILPRIRRLEQFANDPTLATAADVFSKFITQEVSATSAVIGWQVAQTRALEQEALCSAAEAIDLFRNSNPSNASAATPFLWLSYSYLRWAEMTVRGSTSASKCPDGREFVQMLANVQVTLAMFDTANPPQSMAHVITFNRAAIRYFDQASAIYTAMILHDAAFQFRPDPFKQQHKEQRDKLAEQLIKIWADFTATMSADSSITTNDISLAVIGVPAALALRAQFIRNIPDPNGRTLSQAACAEQVTDVNNNAPNLSAKYENTKPAGETGAAAQKDTIYQLAMMYPSSKIRNMFCPEQVAFDNELNTAEKALAAAVKKNFADEVSDRTTLANVRIFANLISCIPAKPAFAGWTGHDVCIADDLANPSSMKSKPFREWLAQAPITTPNGPRYAMVR